MYRHHTRCYQHVAGDRPYNDKDLASFILGTSAPGLIVMLLALAGGSLPLALIALAIQYAVTISVAADEWLYHRLICVNSAGDPHCAIGTIQSPPEIGDFGAFDNDEFFDIRLMPHAPPPADADDAMLEAYAAAVYADGFQGETLLKPSPPIAADLTYDHTHNYKLHCEAEGDFWVAMKDYALLLGIVVAVGAGVGMAAGAALGCAIGGLFGPIGCAIGAIIGAIAGYLGGAAGGAAAGAAIAFNTDQGDVDDANVGDAPLGALQNGDRVIVIGHLVYDGFHEGWHELHPLMGVMRVVGDDNYIEHDPNFSADPTRSPPANLSVEDMMKGLLSGPFMDRARDIRDRMCKHLSEAFAGATRAAQALEEHRWTIHPVVDGCRPDKPLPPPPPPPPIH